MVRVSAVVAAANHHLHERRIRQNHDYGSISNHHQHQPATTSEQSDGSQLLALTDESDDDDDEDAPPFPSYSAFKAAHLLVDMPMTLIILIAFGLLSAFGWPSADMIGLHWSAIGLGAVTWTASEAIRRRLFRFASSSASWTASSSTSSRITTILQSTPLLLFLHTTIQESLRLFAIYISVKAPPELVHAHGIPRPHAIPPKGFFTAFDLALGFAAAETIWRTCELLGNISLYREILDAEIPQAWLVGEENIIGLEPSPNHAQQPAPVLISNIQRAKLAQGGLITDHTGTDSSEPSPSTMQPQHEDAEDNQGGDTVIALDTKAGDTEYTEDGQMNGTYKDEQGDDDTESTSSLSPSEFEYYVREKKRLEIEESYGCALFEIPVAIVAVWRLDATLLNLALTLLLSLPFHEHGHTVPKHSAIPLKLPLIPTFLGVLALHWSVSLLWTLGIRRQRGRRDRDCGMPAISYGTLLVVLACFFASLAAWSALV